MITGFYNLGVKECQSEHFILSLFQKLWYIKSNLLSFSEILSWNSWTLLSTTLIPKMSLKDQFNYLSPQYSCTKLDGTKSSFPVRMHSWNTIFILIVDNWFPDS